ncbi:DUF1364 domain-containing protein [Pseudoalteromonas piscicida]|uniref:DUF1364 domain-containing protein n=1 Tax=Pseudoalteromonas piscicida TaxID=43662 RepID=UPI0005FA35F6|nr:DUF1364 domain-containing protein [Pseudoalteromonas piscicida]KJZ03272.1 phage protein [Pseudoalteromonas piscicida]
MSFKSQKLRNSAEGQECQVRIPGICNFDPSTTILAHVAKGSGVGQKCDDIHATFCCSNCHSEIDRATRITPKDYADQCAYEGMVRTQTIWLNQGLIKVA